MSPEELRTLEAVYREHGQAIWRAVYGYAGGSRDIADEAVAEAFVRASAQIEQIRSMKPWLMRVAFRVAAKELRRTRRSAALSQSVGDHAPEGPRIDAWILSDFTERLSPNQRASFVLQQVMGYSSRETAELLHVSEVAVRVHLHAARRRMREEIEEVERT